MSLHCTANTKSLVLPLALAAFGAVAQTSDAVAAPAKREKQRLLDTLKVLVEIESGTADVEGVTRISAIITEQLRALGGRVDLVPPAVDSTAHRESSARVC